jgi:ribosome-associated protein
VLDLRKITIIADYFVICSGESPIQVKAISEWIEETLRRHGIRPLRIEGAAYAHWVLMDYGSVVVHIFETETRAYYELEKLWIDAEPVTFE